MRMNGIHSKYSHSRVSYTTLCPPSRLHLICHLSRKHCWMLRIRYVRVTLQNDPSLTLWDIGTNRSEIHWPALVILSLKAEGCVTTNPSRVSTTPQISSTTFPVNLPKIPLLAIMV